jgi:hypothetical protein
MAESNYLKWTALGEPYRQVPPAAVNAALACAFPGLRFAVGIYPLSDQQIKGHGSDDDLVEVHFNVSGSAEDLVRHRFADPGWLHNMGSHRGARRLLTTKGLGACSWVRRTKTGFSINGARYDDGLDRIAAIFVPAMLEPCRSARQS